MQITVKRAGRADLTVEAAPGMTLLEALSAGGLRVDAPCGGRGKCGKCAALASGSLSPPDTAEEALVSKRPGSRLTCQAQVLGEAEVELEEGAAFSSPKGLGKSAPYGTDPPLRLIDLETPGPEDATGSLALRGLRCDLTEALNEITAVDSSRAPGKALSWRGELLAAGPPEAFQGEKGPLAAAFDLGTTGLALAVVDPITGDVVSLETALNPQTARGGDVISRVTYASESNECLLELQSLALEGLSGMLLSALGRDGAKRVMAAYVSGNSVMQHILGGVNPRSLAQAPYRPVFTHALDISHLAARLGMSPRARAYTAPAISSYIGGDIVSGLLAVELREKPGTRIFIDMGTNGEIVVSRNGRLAAASCAAGPALEGMNILCGMRAAPGAVEAFTMNEDYSFEFSVIGGGEAAGICGSGLIDICGELVRRGVIGKTGLLSDPPGKAVLKDGRLHLTDRVFLDQLDVRQTQLAKGAIAAAVEMLLKRLGIKASEADEIIIAGAFGSHLRAESLRALKLIPPDFEGPVTFVGNSSLAGSVRMLLNSESLALAEGLAQGAEVLDLGFDPEFQKMFLKHMYF